MGCPPPMKRRCTAVADDEDFAGKLRAFDAARMVHLRAREATKDMIIINDEGGLIFGGTRPGHRISTLEAHGISNQRAALSHGAEALLLFASKLKLSV
eukprot:scaffold5994_cov150-Skeletonema_dohrnii-CCMP3373.AAC.13